MSLLKADMGIAALYSDLVPDRELAAAVFSTIEAEYGRTRDAVLRVTGETELMEFACAEGSQTLPNIFGFELAPGRVPANR